MIITRRMAGLMALGASAARPALAQGEVTRIVASFPPGAALDGVARLLADGASRGVDGRPRGTVVVDNRAGANGNIASALVARSGADGRTLLLAIDTTFSLNPHLYSNLGFDPRELEPVAIAGTYPVVLLVHPSTGITDLAGFVRTARERPMLYASAGNGSPGHLAMEFLRSSLGLPAGSLEHIPFRGNAEAMTDLLAGRVQAGFIAVSGGADFVRDGRLRAIAVSGPRRLAMLPEAPTVAESGHPGFDVRFAYLLMAPRGVPAEVRRDWSALVAAVMADPTARARLDGWAVEPEAGNPEQAAAWIASASERWGKVARETGMRVG
ncbi:Bug family tripartite tricarboxylate transporter substrate binding protein [Muricoccus pecuniae]|uniref:Tripartite-type tricarboxylate transporter receptor subunit TctC n=1 Tax=Muricoccus pecuniae TaxID=693023 RepID=A0A840YMC5_9PROT|nr:tripartite tricarboxylate transporter substrate binding protein [Roseomonas pecuniae]MBB5696482.1 tripartite-type tricarboxylate transporter receptor subunit TctC [Roseomonas pecuniae]